MGIEPTTSSLGSWRSTAELLPPAHILPHVADSVSLITAAVDTRLKQAANQPVMPGRLPYSAISRFSANGHSSSTHCASQRNPVAFATCTISNREYL
jgi:hypothetical protein